MGAIPRKIMFGSVKASTQKLFSATSWQPAGYRGQHSIDKDLNTGALHKDFLSQERPRPGPRIAPVALALSSAPSGSPAPVSVLSQERPRPGPRIAPVALALSSAPSGSPAPVS